MVKQSRGVMLRIRIPSIWLGGLDEEDVIKGKESLLFVRIWRQLLVPHQFANLSHQLKLQFLDGFDSVT